MLPFIKVSHLQKRFDDFQVIEGLDLEINAGEIVVLRGPSGIGKSTFLRCLTYLEPFQAGSVQVGDVTIAAGASEGQNRQAILSVRKQLGFVFQFFNLFPHLTVLENLTIGPVQVLGRPVQEAQHAAFSLLQRIRLEHKSASFPSSLSGGQQQRVGIARALAMQPKGVLLDEPTSSLDPEMKGEIIEVVEDFAQDGLTMVLVTHEPKILEKIATRVVTFGPGCRILS